MTIIEATIEYIQDLFKNNAGGHDADHTMRVYRNALQIAKNEIGCDLEIIALSALLHDADDYKLFSTQNNANARTFLDGQRVAGKRPETIEGKIVQDADRLDAIGAIGIARTFAYGGEHDRPLDASIQHFYDKLLLLKDEMNTNTAKDLAEKRHSFLLMFLKEYNEEIK